jgi:PKD repeat protein
MKKITLLLAASVMFIAATQAKPVTLTVAKTVAQNFYTKTYDAPLSALSLAYTEKDANGLDVYYIFNVSNNGGFVIVSAEDAGKPIIGYSNEGSYITPVAGGNLDTWMQKRKKEIVSMRTTNLAPTIDITQEWNTYTNYTHQKNTNPHKVTGAYPSSTAYLVQSTWDQSPNYNALCPGGSVTGCVATAMSQIMRYWSYPARGLGSSSYCDCTAGGYSENYGTLSANYSNTVYNWTNMPLSLTGANNDVATLMYDAGVSVQMDYAPTGSGAWVITADGPVCAESSYVKYFGYNPSTIYGFYDSTLTSTTLIDTLQNEINNGRPVEYAGWDPTAGGHTWVCDGYDVSNNFHMNWGWSGQDNGWFALTNLNPGGQYKFSETNEALIGIEPRNTLADFTGSPTFGCSGLSTTFTDQSQTNGTLSNWNWSFPGGTPSSSTLQNPTVTYSTPGTYNVTEVVTSTVGKDSLTQNSYVSVAGPSALPLSQNFESGVFPPANWQINNPNNHATTWSLYSGVGGFGKSNNCMEYNNCTGGVMYQRDQIYSPLIDFTGNTGPFLYFDVAYEPYGTQSGTYYSDTLAVYYSTDCGTTWNNVYVKGGMTLCTTGGTAGAGTDTAGGGGCWKPIAAHWRTDTISIPAIANMPSVMFSFENRSGYGSNLFVDNINIPKSPLGVMNITNQKQVNIYPNPTNGEFTVDLHNAFDKAELMLYNVLGQQVYNSELNLGTTQINLMQPSGVYLYKVLSLNGKMLSQGKLIIKQ